MDKGLLGFEPRVGSAGDAARRADRPRAAEPDDPPPLLWAGGRRGSLAPRRPHFLLVPPPALPVLDQSVFCTWVIPAATSNVNASFFVK